MLDFLLELLLPGTRRGWVVLLVVVVGAAVVVGVVWGIVTLLLALDDVTRGDAS